LLALSSGGFKVFGVEMSGAGGKLSRVAAGLIGVIVLGFGAWQAVRQPPAVGEGPRPGSEGTDQASAAPHRPRAPVKDQELPGLIRFGSTTLPVGDVSASQDSVRILDILPAPGSHFPRGMPQIFNLSIQYSLQSTDTALLSVSVAQVLDGALQCGGKSGHLTDATQVPIVRGVHTTNLSLRWSGDSGESSKGHVDERGYLRFVPMFWKRVGDSRGERIRVFEGYERLCMRFD
jgi:hypothetical protein